MLKQKSDKWEQPAILEELHTQACFTAKSLTQDLIEGKVPINYQLEQYSSCDKSQVELLLHRCAKLYSARSDATKILTLAIKVFYGSDKAKRSAKDAEKMLRRLKSMCSLFHIEHHMYHNSFVYRGRDLAYLIEHELLKLGCQINLPSER